MMSAEDSSAAGGATAVSLWDIDNDNAVARIEARRKRISNRLSAAKKLTTMIKVQKMFGGDSRQDEGEEGKHVLVSVSSLMGVAELLLKRPTTSRTTAA